MLLKDKMENIIIDIYSNFNESFNEGDTIFIDDSTPALRKTTLLDKQCISFPIINPYEKPEIITSGYLKITEVYVDKLVTR